jgi:hypothetical protein
MAVEEPLVYLIGDIHGCYQELVALEVKIKRQAARIGKLPMIVSVGDLIDRGPQSAAVVEHFLKGTQAGTHAVVMGNHELMMLECLQEWAPWNFEKTGWPRWLSTYRQSWRAQAGFSRWLSWEDYRSYARCLWISQGGYQTLSSFGCDPHQPDTWQIEPEILLFLMHLPYVWINEQVVVTHALARPKDLAMIHNLQPLRLQHPDAALAFFQHAHSLVWNRVPPTTPPDAARLHVSGHTPVSRFKRWKKAQCLQIDTACVYGGRLSAWSSATQASLSVAAARNYLRDT